MPGKKLLVADDSLTIQKVIRLALSNEGYEIQAVSDGNDAIQQISLTRPAVVLIDVSLPGKTAFEVKEEINSQNDLEEVRFVLMSSAFETVDETLALQVKFHGRLIKPFDPAHLRQVLTDVLGQVPAKQKVQVSSIQHPPQPPAPPTPPSFKAPRPGTMPPPLPQENDFTPFDSEEITRNEPTLPDFQFPQSLGENFPEDRLPIERTGSISLDIESWETFPTPLPPDLPAFKPSPPTLPTFPPLDEALDIQELTESTMSMTHDEDFQWSVKEPVLRPPQRMMDRGGSRFEMTPPREPFPPYEEDFSSHFMPPPLPTEQISIGESRTAQALTPLHPMPPPIPNNHSPFAAPNQWVSPISQEQIEKMIQEQVEATLTKMIQKNIPDIAERLIKQEIHRLLSET